VYSGDFNKLSIARNKFFKRPVTFPLRWLRRLLSGVWLPYI
jgi:hypothetical protein